LVPTAIGASAEPSPARQAWLSYGVSKMA